MKHRNLFLPSLVLFSAFLLWTAALCFVDVRAVGPQGSAVGFASFNLFVHRLTGVHMGLYYLTDWLSLVPIALATGFALLGLVQWLRRKQLNRVDFSLLALGGFYILVLAFYLFFECFPLNYRPVLINGLLEASYPSSTTLLVLCILPTAMQQLRQRVKLPFLRRSLLLLLTAFLLFMVVARFLSGVHWLTDIVGGVLLSAALVSLYRAVCRCAKK